MYTENKPVVSVVIPVYNSEKTLLDTIQCFRSQTIEEIEIICVDDGSTDGSLGILDAITKEDSRVRVLSQKNGGAGAARNRGFLECRGDYTLFFDADDTCVPDLLEKCVRKLEQTDADLVGYNFTRLYPDGSEEHIDGIHIRWYQKEQDVFNYLDFPDKIFTAFHPVPWNKVYRTDFLRHGKLRFDEISSTNDITFASLSLAMADRVTYLNEELVTHAMGREGTITSTKVKNIHNVFLAVSSLVRQAQELPHYETIKNAVLRFELEHYAFALKNYTNRMTSDEAPGFYEAVRNRLQADDVKENEETLYSELAKWCRIIRKYDYETFAALYRKKVVVSMTSFPKRIAGVRTVLDTLLNQSRMADEIVLWLASEQFPDGVKELPQELLELSNKGKLTIRFCKEDLKAHKKYYYAFQEYPDALIITVDDDLLFHRDTIDQLFLTYLEYPNAVAAMRVHIMLIDENKKFLSYNDWAIESDMILEKPHFQLLATGGAGTLYPPKLLDSQMLDSSLIRDVCPLADDLWLKAMEVLSGVPVVLTRRHRMLNYIEGSQEIALTHENVDANMNDVQLARIEEYLEREYGTHPLANLILQKEKEAICSVSEIMKTLSFERQRRQERIKELGNRLKIAYAEKSAINARLQETFHEKSDINALLQRTYREKSAINAKLKQTYQEKAERGLIIKKQQAELDSIRQSKSYQIGLKITNSLLYRSIRKLWQFLRRWK